MIDPALDAAAPDPAVPHQATADPPAVARRRLRLALRRAREAKNYTRSQVASALDWSLSKINRIESGEVTISIADLKVLLAYLEITDTDLVDRLLADARAARRRGWWDEPRFRPHLTPAMQQLLQFESEATAIRYFSPTLIPGLLQTPKYAKAVLNFWSASLPEQVRDVRAQVRLLRRQHVFGRATPLAYSVILDESVILRAIGGTLVMAEQLEELLQLSHRGLLTVKILPLTEGMGAMLGPFAIVDLPGEANALLYRESHLFDEVVRPAAEIDRHSQVFAALWHRALSEEASNRLIQAQHAAAVARLDRQDESRYGGSSHAIPGRDNHDPGP